MRVISGTSRGTKLIPPVGTDTRPTADSVKESLFNIISPNIAGAIFLDLFSGSGAIGIEALSRGASQTVFVEKAPDAVEIIKKNLIKTRLTDRAIIYNIDICECINVLSAKHQKFNIIFMDPPYKMFDIPLIINSVLQSGILEEDGLMIAEHWQQTLITTSSPYEVVRRKDYGKETSVSFIRKTSH